ncbi:MAG: reverse transcriptase family protein [Bacteroidota bacterium]|nr:reverse transcriptase family protein [Bacteroidota bacterium]
MAYKKPNRYLSFRIKKSQPGQFRDIKAPARGLKRLQQLLLLCFTASFPHIDKSAHGFVSGRSVLTNAKPHAGRRFVFNTDIKEFFPSTTIGRVAKMLQLPPISMSATVAGLVANICCDAGSLPQGAPTSPFLTNLVCQRLDRKLRQLAAEHHCCYTRYADDITFSSNRRISLNLRHAIGLVLQADDYTQHEKKIRLQTRSMRQEVTGVIVNQHPNVSREYRRAVRAALHQWQHHCPQEIAQTHLLPSRDPNGPIPPAQSPPQPLKVLSGKIAYLGMIRGSTDALYLAMATKLASLTNKDFSELLEELKLEEIIAQLEKLEQAR